MTGRYSHIKSWSILMLFICACSSESGVFADTQDIDDAGIGLADGQDGSGSGTDADEDVFDGCAGNLIEFEWEGKVECVPELLANTILDIHMMIVSRIQPNDQKKCRVEIEHVSRQPAGIEEFCPDSKFFVRGLSPLGRLCLRNELGLYYNYNGIESIGSIEHDGAYTISYRSCSELECGDYAFREFIVE
jgi:hypothetical protein